MERSGPPALTVAALPLLGGLFDWEDDLTSATRESLADASLEHVDRHLAAPPELDGVHEVNTHEDGDPIYVAVVTVELVEREDPDRDAAYRTAAAVVQALQTALGDEHVRHYDVLFPVGESPWYSRDDRRRIAVTPELADRLDREPSFDAQALREAVQAADDGDHELPPVAWGEPLDRQYYRGSSSSSGSTAATTTFVGT